MVSKDSGTGTWALRIGTLSLFLTILGLAGAASGILPPYTGFRIFGAGAVLGGLVSLIFGLVAIFRGRRHSVPLGRAYVGTLIGGFLVSAILLAVGSSAGAPPIHDITTDPEDPPEFMEILKLGDNPGRDLTYPHGGSGVTKQQREAYPDVVTRTLPLSPEAAMSKARQVVQELGWTEVTVHTDEGVIEAYETSGLFRFVDDIVIRIRPVSGGSEIDLRSTSRVGVSDLGANAARILRFLEQMPDS